MWGVTGSSWPLLKLSHIGVLFQPFCYQGGPILNSNHEALGANAFKTAVGANKAANSAGKCTGWCWTQTAFFTTSQHNTNPSKGFLTLLTLLRGVGVQSQGVSLACLHLVLLFVPTVACQAFSYAEMQVVSWQPSQLLWPLAGRNATIEKICPWVAGKAPCLMSSASPSFCLLRAAGMGGQAPMSSSPWKVPEQARHQCCTSPGRASA